MKIQLTKQTKIVLLLIFGIALLGGFSCGGWGYWRSKQTVLEPQAPPVEKPKPTGMPTPVTRPTDDPNWNLYINEEYGFSVEYPAGWDIKEESNGFFEGTTTLRDLSLGTLWVLVDKDPVLGVLDWSAERWDTLVLEKEDLPEELNAALAGTSSLVGYSPPGGQGWASVFAVFKKGGYIFVLKNKAVGRGDPPLWSIYEHFLRTFEFEGTKDIPDKLPNFPMGF